MLMFGRTEEENDLFEKQVFTLLPENERKCFKSQFSSAGLFFSGVEHAFQIYLNDAFENELESKQADHISKAITAFLSL
jgi:hypothetical protein